MFSFYKDESAILLFTFVIELIDLKEKNFIQEKANPIIVTFVLQVFYTVLNENNSFYYVCISTTMKFVTVYRIYIYI